jgi:ferredoxin-NADP reductase
MMRIARPPGFDFSPGQYIKVGIPDSSRRNDYSIASAPHQPFLELCIKAIAAGRLSPQLIRLREGDRIEMSPDAKGKFLLDSKADVHLMVATGTGIAPLRSMLLESLHREQGPRFVVLHGASHADGLPYRAELEELSDVRGDRLTYVATVSRPGGARNHRWSGRTGRVDNLAAEMLASGKLQADRTRVYACGNSGMISAMKNHCAAAGYQITTEAFD